jgi:hypothetical protein
MGIMMLALTGVALATERYDRVLDDMVSGPIAVVVRQKALVSAVARQNQETAGYSLEQIEALDARWRAELEAEEQPFIDALLERELSQYLMMVQKNSDGWITEIMIMDAKGLNVAQSQATSDYWQGDEAKWQVPFNEGRIHIGDIELDESTQSVQTQISVPIKDRFSKIIGAATFGISFHP